MTVEEAIRILKEYLELDKDIENEYIEAQKVAIKALEEQANPNSIRINFVGEEEAKEFEGYLNNRTPTQELKQEKQGLKQEPCEDCVSRQAVLDNAYAYGNGLEPDGYCVNVEGIQALPPVTPQEPNTWSLDDAREDFMSDVYNTLDFLPTNDEANQIIDSFDSVTSGIRQESVLDKIRTEIVEEKEYAYADFERYNEDLGQDWEDDFRYGMERCIELIDKYKA